MLLAILVSLAGRSGAALVRSDWEPLLKAEAFAVPGARASSARLIAREPLQRDPALAAEVTADLGAEPAATALATAPRARSPAMDAEADILASARGDAYREEKREAAREVLFKAIDAFKAAEAEAGKVSVDFGVKGGELDKDTRAPANLKDVWAPPVLAAAEAVEAAIARLEVFTPNPDATKFLGTAEGAQCPLHGAWRNVWTTAADASFSPNSKRGDAKVYNVIDGPSGTVTNFIDFASGAQFRVKLRASTSSTSRVNLVFRLVKISPPKKILGLIRTITIPVPGPFITRVQQLLRRGPKKGIPPAYFDVLYLDEDLRVHRTGQGNLFVQRRAAWSS